MPGSSRRSGASAGTPARHGRGAVGLVLLLAVVLVLPGCAVLFGSHDVMPSGLSRYDHDLRRLLSRGAADSALALLAPDRSHAGDELLRLQHEVVAAHYAGDYARSSEAIERAVRIAEDRYTKSVTKALLSVLGGDRVLPYDPPAPERVLLHYYGALNYLRTGELDEAAVEARRLSRRLEIVEEEDASEVTPGLLASLWHFSGAVFEAAGQANDAAVAYRRAAAVGGVRRAGNRSGASRAMPRSPYFPAPAAGVEPASTDGAAAARGRSSAGGGATGEVLVVVERGFVAHRVERDLTVLLLPRELKALRELEDYDPEDDGEADLDVVRRIASRTFHGGGRVRSWRFAGRRGDEDPILFRIAWPEFVDTRTAGGPAAVVAGSLRAEPMIEADLSDAVRAAYRDRRVMDLAKALLRAAVREGLADAIEEEVSEEDETLGEVAGWAARIGGALLERADTRSWHLLPGRLELFRMELPAGRHALAAILPGDAAGRDSVDLGTVDVRPGGVTVVSTRDWR